MARDVVGLVGGLGNQLFQYAFARWLHSRTGRTVRMDLSAYRRRPDYLTLPRMGLQPVPVERALRWAPHPLGRFPVAARVVRATRGPRVVRLEGAGMWFPSDDDLQVPAWYYGYWQRPDMVADVLDGLRAEVAGADDDESPQEPVAMHVRRGDMTGHVSALGGSYFPRALRSLLAANDLDEGTPVAVYSDDPEWCRAELQIPRARHIAPGDAAVDLLALSRHPFLVLSGSTFSWWAAQLRPRPRHAVAAPFPFSMVPGQHLEDPGWLPVSRDLGTGP